MFNGRGGDDVPPAISKFFAIQSAGRLAAALGVTFAELVSWPADVVDQLQVVHDAQQDWMNEKQRQELEAFQRNQQHGL